MRTVLGEGPDSKYAALCREIWQKLKDFFTGHRENVHGKVRVDEQISVKLSERGSQLEDAKGEEGG